MDDVAAVAGVSRGTVSRVLNGGHNVSRQALAAVERAISKTGYVVNQHARGLVTQQSGSVAFILAEPQDKLFEDPNFNSLLRGCTQVLADHDITLLLTVAATGEDRKRIGRWVTAGHVDGALLISGEVAMARLLDQAPDLDAVFVCSDLMAAGAIATLQRAGKRIPGDIAVGGFDDSKVATTTTPPLTTIRVPWARQSAEMVRLLLALIAGGDHAAVILPTELIVRESA
jgi:DNA-binding LacI/PurR family transcriptional regulator